MLSTGFLDVQEVLVSISTLLGTVENILFRQGWEGLTVLGRGLQTCRDTLDAPKLMYNYVHLWMNGLEANETLSRGEGFEYPHRKNLRRFGSFWPHESS